MANAADRKQLRATSRRVASRERRFQNALRAVLSTRDGRLVFGDHERGLLARFGVYRSTFDQVATTMAYRAGKQDAGHEILALITQAAPDEFLLMERESRGLEAADANEQLADELDANSGEKEDELS